MDTFINIVLTVLFFGAIAMMVWLIYSVVCCFKTINNTPCENQKVVTEAIIAMPNTPPFRFKVKDYAVGSTLIYINSVDGTRYATSTKNCIIIDKPVQEE